MLLCRSGASSDRRDCLPIVAFWGAINIIVLFLVCMMSLHETPVRRGEERFSLDELIWIFAANGTLFHRPYREVCAPQSASSGAVASSENDHGSMNLASNTAPLACTRPSSVAPIQRSPGCRTWRLHVRDQLGPVLASYQRRLRSSVDRTKLDERGCPTGPPAQPRRAFSRQSRSKAASFIRP